MKTLRIILSLCIVAALIVAVSGCSKKTDGKKRIAGMVFQEDQFFRLVLFGMKDAAAKNGAELLEANSAGKPDKEIQLINTYIASGIDAIVVSPLSAKASVSALSRAREKGIVVVTYNTTVEGDIPVSYIESDQADLGRSTGKAAREYVEKNLGGNAKVAILAFQSQTPEQSAMRVGGFREEITKLPGVTIVAEQDAWLAEQAVKKGGRHPHRPSRPEHHLGRQRGGNSRCSDGREECRKSGEGGCLRHRHWRSTDGFSARRGEYPAGHHRSASIRNRLDGRVCGRQDSEGRTGGEKSVSPGPASVAAETRRRTTVQRTPEIAQQVTSSLQA